MLDLHAVCVDDILNYIGYGPLQVLAFLLAALTAFAFGLEMVIFAYLDIPIQDQWNLTSVEYAILPSMTGLGNIIGGFGYGLLCDYYGRVWPYAVILCHVGVVGLASAFSPNFATLVVLRTLASVAVTGIASVMFSTLVEFLPVRNRGKVMVSVLIVEAIGICSMGGMSWWLITTYPKYGWRFILVASSLPYFVPAIFRLAFPLQSPRYLIGKGEHKKAMDVFKKMARINGKCLSINESNSIQCIVGRDSKPSKDVSSSILTSSLSIFKPPYLRTTLCLSVIFVTETASYFASSIFLPVILKEFGMNPYFISFIGYLGQIPGIMLMSIIVEWEKVGRINSLRLFSLLTTSSFLLFGFLRNEAAIAVSVVFIYFSMVPMISLLYTYISEVYPTQTRAFTLGYFTNLSAAFGMALPFLGGYLAEVSTHTHWLFPTVWAGVFLLQFVVSLFLNVETLRRNLIDTSVTSHT